MKHIKLITLFVLSAATANAFSFTFNDVQYWFGNGSKQAGVVIQWDTADSPQALAWGVRYDGALTGENLFDIVLNDARLYAYQDNFSFGRGIYGIGYDSNNGGVTGNGYTNSGSTPDTAVANDPTDKWKVGWFSNGFWSLWSANGANATGFSSASTGVSGYNVNNNDWMLLAFAPASNGWSTNPPTNIAAAAAPVPEPATGAIIGVGALALMRRKQRS